jgi:hypothetical protein
MRSLIREADPEIIEDRKWKNRRMAWWAFRS